MLQESCSDNTLVTQLNYNVDNSRQVGISNKQARSGNTAQHKAHLQCVAPVQHDLREQRDHNARLSDPGPSPNKMHSRSDRLGKENDEHGFRVKRLSSRPQPPGFGATLTISNDAHDILIGPPTAAARHPGMKSPKPHTNQKYASARTKDQEHTHNHTGDETYQHKKTEEQGASRSTSQQYTASRGTILEHVEVSGKTIGLHSWLTVLIKVLSMHRLLMPRQVSQLRFKSLKMQVCMLARIVSRALAHQSHHSTTIEFLRRTRIFC